MKAYHGKWGTEHVNVRAQATAPASVDAPLLKAHLAVPRSQLERSHPRGRMFPHLHGRGDQIWRYRAVPTAPATRSRSARHVGSSAPCHAAMSVRLSAAKGSPRCAVAKRGPDGRHSLLRLPAAGPWGSRLLAASDVPRRRVQTQRRGPGRFAIVFVPGGAMTTENVFVQAGMALLLPGQTRVGRGTNFATVPACWAARCGVGSRERPPIGCPLATRSST